MLKPEEIKALIDADKTSERKRRAATGQRYYEGKHDILQYRMFYYNSAGKLVEDTTRSNMRIPHPFFTELVDQLVAYMLSFDENPIRAKDSAEGLQDHLDAYFDDEFWGEIGDVLTDTNAKGFGYLYGYKGEQDRLTFQAAESMGVVEVRAKSTDERPSAVIYWYTDRVDKDKTEINRVQVHTPNDITYYVMNGKNGQIELDKERELNPQPNVVYRDQKGKRYGLPLGFVPFWRVDNNKRQTSGLEPIKPIIDDYDLMKCGLSNNLQDFDHPLYVVRGFQAMTEKDMEELEVNLRTKRRIGTPDGQSGVDIVTTDIPVEARKANMEADEKNIYRFGMGFNSSQVGDGNVTNVVIRSRYTLLDLKADKLEKQLKKMLKKVVRVVLDEINADNGTDYQITDVRFDFVRNIPSNETENIANEKVKAETRQLEVNTLLNAAVQIGDEAVLKALCELFDLDPAEVKAQLEKAQEDTPDAAQRLLDQVVTDDDEQEAEASPAVPAE